MADVPRTNGMADALSPPPKTHPILSAVQFAAQARETGGATMDLKTGRVLAPHTPGFVVGGQPDRQGRQIPTVEHSPESGLRLDTILNERTRLSQTVHPSDHGAALGYWRDSDKGANAPHEADASSIRDSKAEAVSLGRKRGERAIWNNSKMEEIRLR